MNYSSLAVNSADQIDLYEELQFFIQMNIYFQIGDQEANGWMLNIQKI